MFFFFVFFFFFLFLFSNGQFRLDYKAPTLNKNFFTSETLGTKRMIIQGNNFGLNATVRVGNVLPRFEGPTCVCDGGLICGHDTTAAAASASSGGRSCFLPKISQTHEIIEVVLPQGIGININMIIVAVNQIGIAKISFHPPEIDLSQTSPTLVTTYGTGMKLLFSLLEFFFFFFLFFFFF